MKLRSLARCKKLTGTTRALTVKRSMYGLLNWIPYLDALPQLLGQLKIPEDAVGMVVRPDWTPRGLTRAASSIPGRQIHTQASTNDAASQDVASVSKVEDGSNTARNEQTKTERQESDLHSELANVIQTARDDTDATLDDTQKAVAAETADDMKEAAVLPKPSEMTSNKTLGETPVTDDNLVKSSIEKSSHNGQQQVEPPSASVTNRDSSALSITDATTSAGNLGMSQKDSSSEIVVPEMDTVSRTVSNRPTAEDEKTLPAARNDEPQPSVGALALSGAAAGALAVLVIILLLTIRLRRHRE